MTSHQIEGKIDSDLTWMTSDKTDHVARSTDISRHTQEHTEGHREKATDSNNALLAERARKGKRKQTIGTQRERGNQRETRRGKRKQ